MERATAQLLAAVNAEDKRYAGKPTYDDTVTTRTLDKTRTNTRTITGNRHGAFSPAVLQRLGRARDLLHRVVRLQHRTRPRQPPRWRDRHHGLGVRLHRGELPIVWASDGRQYNPDFLAHEGTDRAWLIETKSDKDMPTEVVQAKREAAKRWANIANATAQFGRTWGYLLISETNLRTAKGSWAALVRSSGG
jgi:type III restriction enzyme